MKLTTLILGGLAVTPSAGCRDLKDDKSNSATDNNSQKKSNPKIVLADDGVKLNVIGDNQLIKLTGEDTGNQFTLVEQDNVPGMGIPPHVHENEDEIFKVNSGTVEMMIGGETKVLNAGDLVFCPRGIPHAWSVIGDENAKVSLSIFPSGLEHMFEELAKLPAGPPDMQKVTEICGKYKVRFV